MYTKQQREEIYWKTLELITKKMDDEAFMCHLLSKAVNDNAPCIEHDRLIELFPEWANCRPIGFIYGKNGNLWGDAEMRGVYVSIKEHNALRETILCLSLAQL